MTAAAHTLTVAFVVKLVAKEEKATTFWIVDAFASQTDRQAHIEGPIAAALMANADRLLAAPPEILPAEVLAAKVPPGRQAASRSGLELQGQDLERCQV